MHGGSTDCLLLFTSLDSFHAAKGDRDKPTEVSGLSLTVGSLCRDKST